MEKEPRTPEEVEKNINQIDDIDLARNMAQAEKGHRDQAHYHTNEAREEVEYYEKAYRENIPQDKDAREKLREELRAQTRERMNEALSYIQNQLPDLDGSYTADMILENREAVMQRLNKDIYEHYERVGDHIQGAVYFLKEAGNILSRVVDNDDMLVRFGTKVIVSSGHNKVIPDFRTASEMLDIRWSSYVDGTKPASIKYLAWRSETIPKDKK